MSHKHSVHLVGSLGLPDVETGFRRLAETLGDRAARYPDGEPGERNYWIRWQVGTFEAHPDFEFREARTIEGYKDDKQRPAYALRDDIDRRALHFEKLGYADVALESYEVFRHLKSAGDIPETVRFQVCLPTAAALVASFVDGPDREDAEPAIEDAMRREVMRIADGVPEDELAIQWDAALEPVAVDGGPPMHYRDFLNGSIERMARQGGYVPPGVQLGYHLCYGDPGHKHVVEPPDLSTCVALANGLARATPRRIDWFHMPVPRERSDDDYFAALEALDLDDASELYVGLVHHTDGREGAQKRMAAVDKWLKSYGIATECGFGRRAPETITPLLRLHAELADG